MTEKEKSLKEQNQRNLTVFLIVNFAILVSVSFIDKFDITTINNIVDILKWLILLPIIIHIVNGLISSDHKATLVFWRIKNPNPGSRVFTELAQNDPRINIGSLEIKFGQLPTDPIKQNQLWYGIYKKHRNDITIIDSHKNYLLSRDLMSISFLFLLSYLIYLAIFKAILNSNNTYLSFLVLQYMILALVAQQYGKRFVCNVLAEES